MLETLPNGMVRLFNLANAASFKVAAVHDEPALPIANSNYIVTNYKSSVNTYRGERTDFYVNCGIFPCYISTN